MWNNVPISSIRSQIRLRVDAWMNCPLVLYSGPFRESVWKVPPIALTCRSRQSDVLGAKEQACSFAVIFISSFSTARPQLPRAKSFMRRAWGSRRQRAACRARRSLDAPPRRRARACRAWRRLEGSASMSRVQSMLATPDRGIWFVHCPGRSRGRSHV